MEFRLDSGNSTPTVEMSASSLRDTNKTSGKDSPILESKSFVENQVSEAAIQVLFTILVHLCRLTL